MVVLDCTPHQEERASMVTLNDRYRGTLLGVLVGDALGAPYEKWEPERIRADFDARGGLTTFDYEDPWKKHGVFPAGLPTDDSELTAALAESLIACNGSAPEDQYTRFKSAVEGKSFLWDGFTHGFGRTTRLMLKRDTYAESQASAHLFSKATNGSLMRSAPLALFYQGQQVELAHHTAESSCVTHVHPLAVECCLVFVNMLDALCAGASPNEARKARLPFALREPTLSELWSMKDIPEPEATNAWPPAGSALHTLHIAAWTMTTATDFRDGIERAVLKGGDTDTAAAVTGALLGAYFGEGGIPLDWVSIVKGASRMRTFADALYEKNQSK